MSYAHHPLARPASRLARTPWLVFVFLAAAFFFISHDVAIARDGYNPSGDDLTAAVTDGSPTRRIGVLSLGIFAIISLIRHRAGGHIRINGPLGWAIVGFATLAMVSPIWAEDRVLTLTRVAVFAVLCTAAVAVVHRFSFREIILWTCFTSGSYVVIGVLLEALFGTFRPFASGYRFAGTLHPNSQGINCALLLLSAIAAADVEKRRRVVFWICAFGGFIFLVLTASRTAFAAAIIALVVYMVVVCSRRAKIAMAYALSIVICVLLLGFGNAFLPGLKSAAMLGRDGSTDGTFNGRTGVWDGVSHYVQRRPILGYGYGGFWTPSHIREISDEEKWGIPDGHSAYLDYLLTLGAVGLIAYVLLLFAGIQRAFHFHRLFHNSAYAFCGVILVLYAMDGFLESAVIEPSVLMFLTWIILVSLASKDCRNPNLNWRLRSANMSGTF